MPPSAVKAVETRADRVVGALEETRASIRRCRGWTALAAAGLAMLAAAVVVAVLDVSWVLPGWARALGLLGSILTGAGVGARSLRRSGFRFEKLDAAAEVEAAFPELGQRVRTTLEYAEPTPTTAPASPTLVEALVDDTDKQTRHLEFPAVVPWSTFKGRALGLAAAVVAVGVMMIYDPTLRVAAARLLLLPAHYTTLTVEPGDKTVKEGADFALRATVAGRPVERVEWLRRPTGSTRAWTSTPLGLDDLAGKKRALVGPLDGVAKGCQDDFEYRVVAGEVESPTYRVSVTHALHVKAIQAAIEPPSYTRLPRSTVKAGNFRAPEGSKVRLQVTLDRAPASGRIEWTPEGSKVPKTVPLAVDGKTLAVDLPTLEKDAKYEVMAVAADGMKLEPARYAIKVQPDETPTVTFVKPSDPAAVTPTTEVPALIKGADDYGVARLGIAYRINDGPEETLYLDEPKAQPTSAEGRSTFFLEKHPLTIADSVTYYGFVEDNRRPGPHKVKTELRFIDILPYKQDYQISPGGGGGGSKSVTLEELILRERRTLNRTFAHEGESPLETKAADRLSKEQAELAIATEKFAAALGDAFGPISPLEAAKQAMGRATASLSTGDVASSLAEEQLALASLIQARQNLRKLLSNSQSAGQCQKIDRMQREQEIRRPPADPSRQAEIAKLAEDVQKLADREKQFAEGIEPKSGGGPKFDKPDAPKPGESPKNPGAKPGSNPGQSQAEAAKEADRLRSLAKEDKALTDLARRRMDRAAAEVKKAAEDSKADRPDDAADSARRAAEQLDRLAEQVAGLKANELGARLAKARDLAQATAKGERDLAGRDPSKPGDGEKIAAEQGNLAERAGTLADLLKQVQSEAAEEDRPLASAVDKATQANDPTQIERAMRAAANQAASGDRKGSGRSMAEAAEQLDGLARDLEAARKAFLGPKLQQLLAAERKAAEARKAMEGVDSEAKKAEAEKAMEGLAKALDGLKPGEGSLKKAADRLAQASGAATDAWTVQRNPLKPGLYAPPIAYTDAVREASKALQAKIQELILDDALVDRDGAVPPGYEGKVADYFRVLSEDVR